jgi:hypothetical protein
MTKRPCCVAWAADYFPQDLIPRLDGAVPTRASNEVAGYPGGLDERLWVGILIGRRVADGTDTPSRHDQLAADHARLKRDNADLARNLAGATAVIQRLALDNHHLQQQPAAATGTVALNQARRTRRDPNDP